MKYRLEIERARWACANYDRTNYGSGADADRFGYPIGPYAGEDHGLASLVNEQGAMCCLGFALRQAGVPRNACEDVGLPENVPGEALEEASDQEFLALFVGPPGVDTELSTMAVEINDDKQWSLAERERQLVHLFARHDIDLVFV